MSLMPSLEMCNDFNWKKSRGWNGFRLRDDNEHLKKIREHLKRIKPFGIDRYVISNCNMNPSHDVSSFIHAFLIECGENGFKYSCF